MKENWDFYIGDHFQFWNGASIDDSAKSVSTDTRKLYYKELERIFHSYNICGRIVSHYVNALVGKPFTLSLSNKDGSDREIPPEVSNLIDNWLSWQSKSNIKKGGDHGSAIAEAITQMLATGRGYLRLYRPKRFQNLNEPYQKIVLHCPRRGSIEAKRDEDEILYWAQYTYGEGKTETYELLDNGLTRVTDAGGNSNDINYQGSLPLFELSGRCLITEDLKQIQKAINKLLTMWDKNLEYAGFPERVILGGQPPGHWEEDKTTGQSKFVPNPALLELGADKIAFIPGLPIGDRKNPTGYTNPQMFYRDPVNPDTFVKSLETYKSNGYEVAGLGHLMAQGGDRISGKSRIAGKEDYVADLGNYERIIEDALEEIVSLVGLFLNKDYPKFDLKNYIPVADLNLSITSPPEEREQNRLDLQAGAMSLSTLVSTNGRDPVHEITLIEADRKRSLEILQQKVDFTQETGFENSNI
jgi:hypothetical protein